MAKVRFRPDRGFWLANYTDNQGNRKQVKAGRTKAQADETLRKIQDKLHRERIDGGGEVTDMAFSDFVEEYKKYSSKNKRETTAFSESTLEIRALLRSLPKISSCTRTNSLLR